MPSDPREPDSQTERSADEVLDGSGSGSSSGDPDISPTLSYREPSDGSTDGSTAESSNVSPDASASSLPRWLGKRVGRFRIISMLGQGAWGRVFEAEDTQLRRRVALKCINTNSKTRGPVPLERLLTEARAATAIEHPNVTQIFEVGEHKGIFFIAMELAEGGSTQDLVEANGPLDPVRACQLAAEAGDALQLAHDCNIIHRDVKPANLLLARNGRCKVTDFGLATGGDPSDPLHASKQGGTPYYIAPEIVKGAGGDIRSDIYSLGATLFFLLTGRHIVSGDNRAAVLKAQLRQPPPNLRDFRPEIDPGLAQTVAKALAKDPSERFDSARSFAKALRVYTVPLAATANTGPTVSAPTAVGDTSGVGMKKIAPIIAAVCGLVLLAIVVVMFVRRGSEEPTAAATTGNAAAPSTPAEATRTSTSPPNTPPNTPKSPTAAAAATVEHTFTLDVTDWNDKPDTVHIAGDFNDWNGTTTSLTDSNSDNVWSLTTNLAPGLHHYKFVIDGDRWINDPASDPALDADDAYGGVNSGVEVGGRSEE